MFLFIADHGTSRGYSDGRWYVELSVITSCYIYFTLRCQHNMTICGLPLHRGNTESPKNLAQKFTFQLGTLYPHGIDERLSFHLFICKLMPPYFYQWQSSSTLSYKAAIPHNSSIHCQVDEGISSVLLSQVENVIWPLNL